MHLIMEKLVTIVVVTFHITRFIKITTTFVPAAARETKHKHCA